MVWCNHCNDDCTTERDPDKGYICCVNCGKILDQDIFFSGPTFEKTGSGQSRLAGSIIHSVQSGYSASRERTLMKGRDEIRDIVNHLRVGGGDSIINKAHAFYRIAIDKNFTRGRRTSHVAAACLYIACRQMKKAYLLIDFSDYLQTNVYVLGAVFLQLCKALSLDGHPIIQKIVDPSLFIHRFTERLLGRKNNAVSETALRIVASMKRDWMQTGRKPSGLCGAALYISAHSHGVRCSKSDITTVAYICEATLTKRLIEFENTESGCLTIEEFLTRADEFDEESYSNQLPRPGEVLCKHKNTKEPHFAHGLCRKCYNKFIKISGGLQGGAEPPAFQRAERQRMEKAKAEEQMTESNLETDPCDLEHGSVHDVREAKFSSKVSSDAIGYESPTSEGPDSTGHLAVDSSACNETPELNNTAVDEEENFSDIDDVEVDGYLHNDEEKRYKTIIWEVMNKEYLEEQAAKEAAAAAAKEAHDSNGADATAAASTKSRKQRKRRCAEDARNSTPAQTAAEATTQLFKGKSLSSKVNYEALGALFPDKETEKKQKIESDAGDDDADGQHDGIEEDDNAFDTGDGEDGDQTNTYEDGDYGDRAEDYAYDDEYDFEY